MKPEDEIYVLRRKLDQEVFLNRNKQETIDSQDRQIKFLHNQIEFQLEVIKSLQKRIDRLTGVSPVLKPLKVLVSNSHLRIVK